MEVKQVRSFAWSFNMFLYIKRITTISKLGNLRCSYLWPAKRLCRLRKHHLKLNLIRLQPFLLDQIVAVRSLSNKAMVDFELIIECCLIIRYWME